MTLTGCEWSFTSRDGVEDGVVRAVELIRGAGRLAGGTSFLERRSPRFAPQGHGDGR
ncbi:hypothetical protein GCM10023199_30990 [Actinomycetospora chibensis]